MHRIGIVTNYSNINYGSALQSYALQSVLGNLGYDCENIRYTYSDTKPEQRPESPLRYARRIYGRLRYPGVVRKAEKFRTFVATHIRESGEVYTSLEELRSANGVYDSFVCGSDQIWAPNQFHEWYYLAFVDTECRRVAYAPSIGLPSIPSALRPRMAGMLKGIAYLSVREQQGADIILDLTGRDVPVVVDPTLLLSKESWLEVASDTRLTGDYILCYFLGAKPEHRRWAEEIRGATGYRLVVLPRWRRDYQWGDLRLWDSGPLEFVGLIAKAKLVLTDSFHGVAFCTNLNRPFYAMRRFDESDPLCQNSRVDDLLRRMDLRTRLMTDGSRATDPAPIDYGAVNEALERERDFSMRYLSASLRASTGGASAA